MKNIHIILIVSFFLLVLGFIFLQKEKFPIATNSAVGTSEKLATAEEIPMTYSNPRQYFSFQYPNEYKVNEMIDRDSKGLVQGEIVLVQAKSGDRERGLQITILPFDETDTTLTKERIQKDIPDMQINDAQTIVLGGVDALSFSSNNSDFGGASKEVWLVHNNFLFQISTHASNTALVNNILSTWQFQ